MGEKSTMKTLIKNKLKQKVSKKEDEATVRKLYMDFPKDKPSYSLDLLDQDDHIDTNVDEEWLYSKAQAIQDKLEEFGIDVDIE